MNQNFVLHGTKHLYIWKQLFGIHGPNRSIVVPCTVVKALNGLLPDLLLEMQSQEHYELRRATTSLGQGQVVKLMETEFLNGIHI